MQVTRGATGIGGQAPKIRERKAVPLFYLPAMSGGESGPAALRSKYNMVLLFLERGAESDTYLGEVAATYADIEAAHARVVAVVAEPIERVKQLAARLPVPFTLLSDENGAATARMLGEGAGAGLCVADRYGIAAYVEIRERAAQLSGPRTALEWLDFVQIQCPE